MKALHLLYFFFSIPAILFSQNADTTQMYLYYPDARLYSGNTALIPNRNVYSVYLYTNEVLTLGNSVTYAGIASGYFEVGVHGRTDRTSIQALANVFHTNKVFVAASLSAAWLTYSIEPSGAIESLIPPESGMYFKPGKSDSSENVYGVRLEASLLVTNEFLLSAGAGALLQEFGEKTYPFELHAGALYRPFNSIQLKLEYTGYSEQRGSLRNKAYAGLTLLSFFASIDVGYLFIKDVEGMGLKQGFVFAAALYF